MPPLRGRRLAHVRAVVQHEAPLGRLREVLVEALGRGRDEEVRQVQAPAAGELRRVAGGVEGGVDRERGEVVGHA